MKSLLRITSVILFLHAGCPAAEPSLDIRILTTDPKTSGFLKNALQDGKTSAVQIEEKLDAMVKGRTLTELARFKQQPAQSGQIQKFEKDRKEIKVGDGVDLPGGISVEVLPTFGPTGLVDIRIMFKRSVELDRNKIETETTNTTALIKGDRWEILSAWGNEKQTTLLLAKATGADATEEIIDGSVTGVYYQSEIRWCEPADLKTFGESTPETRSKAVTWLTSRSTLIAKSGIRARQYCTQENILEWIHDLGAGGWVTAQLGWTLQFETAVDPNGKLLDFKLASNWHPLDAKSPPAKADFSYEFSGKTESGNTIVIEPKTRPDKGPVPVIFVSPVVQTVEEGK